MSSWLKKQGLNTGLTAYITHTDCLAHDMGSTHPESPARLSAIRQQLLASEVFTNLQEVEAPKVTRAQLTRVHSRRYIEYIEASAPTTGIFYIDPDTALSAGTLNAARRAAGAVVKGVDLVCQHQAPNAFCAVRPPGHHAQRSRAMGFCFFNNIAVGVAHALAVYPLTRIAIVDFDVHHGNGTEDIFCDDPRVLMLSIFQHPFYPYSGIRPLGANMHNVPLAAGSDGQTFRKAVENTWLPALQQFQPQMLFISAGFDAHRADAMGSLQLEACDYEWVTQHLMHLAKLYCQRRIISVLEGGYHLSALAQSATAHIRVLAGDSN